MKHLTKLSVLLIASLVVLLCLFASPTKANAATSGYYTYEVSYGHATITDVDESISGAITIPSTLGGYPVTSIGSRAFSSCDSLTSVTIGNSVTSIGNRALYYCTSLTSITIPDSVTSIGEYAFSSCDSLTSVTIPDSVTSIGDYAFSGCSSLTGIYVDVNNRCYWNDAHGVLFNKNQTQLIQAPGRLSGNYIIPDSVTSIGSEAFYNCTSLTSVTIPDGVTSIGSSAFYNCTSLTSVTIPDGVTSIGYSMFSGCSSLTSVTIPDSVIGIGGSAFRSCRSLTSVTIPDSVTSIGSYAFDHCTSLTGIYVDAQNPKYSSDDDGVLFNKAQTQLIQAPGRLSGNYIILDSVTSIGDYAFRGCSSLTSVTIPDSVTSIGTYAFAQCTSLTGIYVDVDNPNYSNDAYGVLFNKDQSELIRAPGGLCGSYTIPDSVTSIGSCGFEDCYLLTSVTIPDNVTSIGYGAFLRCSSLTSVAIGQSVTSIGGVAFASCSSLTSVTIPDSVTSIDPSAFSGCSSLTSVTIPDSVTSIGVCVFLRCSSLTSVTIPNSVTSIDTSAFSDCTSLTSVTYCGTEDQWNQIFIGAGNSSLTSATRYYHNWNPATCTAPRTCSVCGTTEGDYAHEWSTATCTTPKTCTLCNATEGEPLGHSGIWVDLMEATCTQSGVKARICNVCGTTESQTVPALGHQGESVLVAPTCTTDGYTTTSCTVCGETAISDIVPALGHSYESVITAPTCTEQGYTINTCTVCGAVTTTDIVTAKGHSWSAWVQLIAPTCAKEGSQMRFCYCGTKETETLAKLAHNYVDGICAGCNQKEKLGDKLENDVHLTGLILTEDLYIDLNGYSLSGTINTNGYKVYGMDSTTNGYTCDTMGYFSCVDEKGNAIIPEKLHTTPDMMRYMTIETENGYTFHRFYLGITSVSLAPTVTGFGYKAEFYGDKMVQGRIASIGYNLWLTEDLVISRTSAFKNMLTLRLKNFDVKNYGETPVNASVSITLTDGTIIESATASYSMRQVVEDINANWGIYSIAQRNAVKAMCEKIRHIVSRWNLDKILPEEDDGIIDIPIINNPDGNP